MPWMGMMQYGRRPAAWGGWGRGYWGESEWEEEHREKEMYHMLHKVFRWEMEEEHKINEIYELVHEIARMVAAERAPYEGTTPMMPPAATMPYTMPGYMYPGGTYTCPGRATM